MKKATRLIILRGMYEKVTILRVLTRDHLNANGWDTEAHREAATALYDEIIDMVTTIRRESA